MPERVAEAMSFVAVPPVPKKIAFAELVIAGVKPVLQMPVAPV